MCKDGFEEKSVWEEEKIPVSGVSMPQGISEKPSENEIDVIFGTKKRRIAPDNQEVLAEDGEGARSSFQKEKKVKKLTPPVDEEGKRKVGKQSRGVKSGKTSGAASELNSKPRKKTADGLTVYGEDELKWNSKDAGGTPLCPFDCVCCF